MDQQQFSTPLPLSAVRITDPFWKDKMELVRNEVIPYQWEALNDRVPGADPSWCMRNFRTAAKMVAEQEKLGEKYTPPAYTFRGFQALPEDMNHPEEGKFYGFVFQDTDFSKWIEAVAYTLTQHPDEALEKTADEAIDVVCAAQMPNGYLDTYYIINGMDAIFTNLRDHHELYCLGHLVEGAVAYYQATGKDKLLKAACRFADFVDEHFGPEEGKCKGYPGHEIAEMALVRLYEATGNERYLKLSQFFLDERGKQPRYFVEEEKRRNPNGKPHALTEDGSYHQAHKPVREQNEAVGHAVRATYLYSGMADVARLTQDPSLEAACERLWNSIVSQKLYITGGIGGTHIGESFSHRYDLPNDTAYSETCAAIGLAFFARRMLQLSPKREYADVMELALYNTVLAGMALDGKSFFYVNPLSVVPENCRRDQRLSHVEPVRRKWFGCACCPPNLARIVSSIGAYAYTANQDTLYTHLYIGGEVEAAFHGQKMKLIIDSRIPWEEEVKVRIETDGPVQATLAFRLPSWSPDAVIQCGHAAAFENGYALFAGEWNSGDEITMRFPMPVHAVKASASVREDVGQVAFMRGPVVFCAEEKDNCPALHTYRIDAQALDAIRTEPAQILQQACVQLRVPAWRSMEEGQAPLYSAYSADREERCELTLIPYYAWANRGEGEMRVWLRV